MKIRTLIVIDNLHTGGVATSLYNFLSYAHSYMDISLLVFNEESINHERIPNDIHLLKPQKCLHILGKTQKEISVESNFFALVRMVMVVISRFLNGELARKILLPYIDVVGDFDLALAYSQDDGWKSISKGCIDFIISKVVAKKKACIIHCDYSNFGGYNYRQEKELARLDYILCVSNSCKQSFLDCFPLLETKTITCQNFIDVARIRSSVDFSSRNNDGKICFVTVSRLGAEKGLDRVIRAFKILLDKGYKNFFWTIVGGGPEFSVLSNSVQESNLQQYVYFAGNQDNPYQYIYGSDYFLLPSYHEAAPMVYGECASLGVPVITTNTCSALELVSNQGLGLVVENNDDAILEIIENILKGDVDIKIPMLPDEVINKNASEQLKSFLQII